jgi:hypothetical protein
MGKVVYKFDPVSVFSPRTSGGLMKYTVDLPQFQDRFFSSEDLDSFTLAPGTERHRPSSYRTTPALA